MTQVIPIPKQGKSPKKSATRDKCDDVFRAIIRLLGNNRCLRCGTPNDVQCAHIVTRRRAPTRCDEQNAILLCLRCHAYFTGEPDIWEQWLTDNVMTVKELETLEARSIEGWEPDWTELLTELKARQVQLA